MAYTKDLGNVKGDTGDYFEPSLTIDNDGKVTFLWTKKVYNDTTDPAISKNIYLPIYYPESYDERTGNLTLTKRFVTNNDQSVVVHIKGEKGDPGDVRFQTQPTLSNHEFFDEMKNKPVEYLMDSDLYNPNDDDNKVKVKEDVLYITNDNYVYFVTINTNVTPTTYTATKLEGINLDNFYTKQETYSATEIDEMFTTAAADINLIFQLLDVLEPEINEEEDELNGE